MFTRWCFASACAVASLLSDAALVRAQPRFFPDHPTVPLTPAPAASGLGYFQAGSYGYWTNFSPGTYASYSGYGEPSSVVYSPFRYVEFYPPLFTTRAPVAGTSSPNQPASVEVIAPADAVIWFSGRRTKQTGTHRFYTSPVLEKGKRYHYEVKARWMEDGRIVEQTQRVPVSAGASVSVVFPTK